MPIPNLIIPGAPKAGTSALYNFLVLHPNNHILHQKEPHTYSIAERYESRDTRTTEMLCIDASTSYFASPDAPHRIHQDNPEAKVLFILRDPIERIQSHYKWILTRNIRCLPFEKEVLKHLNTFSELDYLKYGGNWKSYLDFSLYSKHIKRYNKFKTKIIYQNDLLTDHENTIKSIFKWIGLDSIPTVSEQHNKTNKIFQTSNQSLKNRLSRFSKSSNKLQSLAWQARKQRIKHLQRSADTLKFSDKFHESVIEQIIQDAEKYSAHGIQINKFNLLHRIVSTNQS